MIKSERVEAAMNAVEITYSEIVQIANDMTNEIFTPINNLIAEIREAPAGISVEKLRDFMLRIQLRAYEISEVKEKSALKAECAEAIRKEKYAQSFTTASGTAGVKDNLSILASSEEVIVETLYNDVANMFKTKLDELHRLIQVLQSILMSKMQEAKLAANGIE